MSDERILRLVKREYDLIKERLGEELCVEWDDLERAPPSAVRCPQCGVLVFMDAELSESKQEGGKVE